MRPVNDKQDRRELLTVSAFARMVAFFAGGTFLAMALALAVFLAVVGS